MKKHLSKELILPAFWLFFFAVSSKSDAKVTYLKKADKTVHTDIGVKKQDILSQGTGNTVNKNKGATFTKAIYLSKY